MSKLDFSTQIAQLINCPVIIYHHFTEKIVGDMDATTTIAKFEQDLTTLLENGYTPISIKQRHLCANGLAEWPEKPFVCTMDDGYESNYTLAYPVFKRLGVHVDILLVTDFVGKYLGTLPHFSWEQAREMEQSGYATMQPHGRVHENNSVMSFEQLYDNVFGCIDDIEKNLGKRDVVFYSIPGAPGAEYTYKNFEYLHKHGVHHQCMNFWEVKSEFLKFDIIARVSIGYDEDVLEDIANCQEGLRERLLD